MPLALTLINSYVILIVLYFKVLVSSKVVFFFFFSVLVLNIFLFPVNRFLRYIFHFPAVNNLPFIILLFRIFTFSA